VIVIVIVIAIVIFWRLFFFLEMKFLLLAVVLGVALWSAGTAVASPAAAFRRGWAVQASPAIDPTTTWIELLLPLKQQNIEALAQHVLKISDPRSPLYGQYLGFDELGMSSFLLLLSNIKKKGKKRKKKREKGIFFAHSTLSLIAILRAAFTFLKIPWCSTFPR
jgi:hypothetical protein